MPGDRPVLCVIVDAEEEFAWDRPVSSANTGTRAMAAQGRAQDIFAEFAVHPTYLVTHPVATAEASVAVLRGYLDRGLCDIGAQLHPWVTPPFGGAVEAGMSYPGSLPEALEREKIEVLVEAIGRGFGVAPVVYKAGRYGFGPNTGAILGEAGFLVDTSLMPRTSYAEAGGPDFRDFDCRPFWFGTERRLLELPVTRSLTGPLAGRCPRLYSVAARPPWGRLRVPGLLARLRLLERITLSPEGSTLSDMRRLTRWLLRRGDRILTLSYHSPSLAPGNTPYVRTPADLRGFLNRLIGFLRFFRDEIGGEFLSVRALHDRLGTGPGSPTLACDRLAPTQCDRLAPTQGSRGSAPGRCLVVANTFPPIHGGTAVVYDSLARFGGGRVSVLAPWRDYRDGRPIPGWEAFDRAAPYRIHRLPLLRTRLTEGRLGWLARGLTLGRDILIRLAVLRAVFRIVRREGITVLCIGELVAGGWLATVCRYLTGLKTVIYIHGEEISIRDPYDRQRRRRMLTLAHADGVVAVSRFTRDALIGLMAVPAAKIALIPNGVDGRRFTPRPRSPALAARYRLGAGPVLLTVGRLHPRKGMDHVILSLPRVLAVIPGLRYLIVGDGPYRPALETLAARHGVADAVILAGPVPDEDLADHYALADVFIMANREMPDGDTEGFGLVFREANACGVPVIAGKAGGSVDAVTDGLNGLLVDGTDIDAIADTILKLFGDDGLRQALKQGGLKIAADSDWSHRVAAFLAFCGIEKEKCGAQPRH
jgi:phosphatidylinositol alpha-1,6-mannosyltransferase